MYFASVVRGSIGEIMGGKMMSRLNILYIHKHTHTDIYIFQLKSNDMNSETILFEPQTLSLLMNEAVTSMAIKTR